MTERWAAPGSVVVESPTAGDANLGSQELQNSQLKSHRRVGKIGGVLVGILAAGIVISGCTDGKAVSGKSETSTIQATATAQKTPETTVIPNVVEINRESVNLLRKIDGKNWDEAISDENFTYSEIFEPINMTSGQEYLREIDRFGVYVTRKNNKTGEVKTAVNKDEFFNLIFPEDPNSRFANLPSGHIKPSDGKKVLAFLVGRDQNVVTEVSGQNLGVIDDPDKNILEVKVGWRDFVHCGPTDTSIQQWNAYTETTGYGIGEPDPSKQFPIVQVGDERQKVDDKICIKPSR